MNELNYAKVYSEALAQAFPYALNFGALYATPTTVAIASREARPLKSPSSTPPAE